FVEVDRELRALVARIAQQRFGVWTAAAQPAVWIHGEPAAEDPRQQKQSADDAGPLMPVLPTAILRAQPQDADPDARYREQNAWRRGPQDDLAPQRRIPAQWREVDPMRDGAEPVPESLHARGREHDLACSRRNVDLGAGGIVHRDPMQRAPRIESSGHGPLIARDGRLQLAARVRVRLRDRHRLLGLRYADALA